jgi:NAD+ synthase (glutamine-hydrolysing)
LPAPGDPDAIVIRGRYGTAFLSRERCVDGQRPFESLYTHGFARVAVGTPVVALADPARNLERTLRLSRLAVQAQAVLLVLPELSLSAYSLDDLVLQDALLAGVERAADALITASRDLPLVILAGAPLQSEGRLFNCALAIHRGELLGVIPKSYLPAYREFYEKRQYSPASAQLSPTITVAGRSAPFGTDLLLAPQSLPSFVLHVEICEDLWVPAPPSTLAALAGATVLANLSASNATTAKADFRRLLCRSQSGRCIAAYLYAGAGLGESTTDLAWDGHALVCENGELLGESTRYALKDQLLCVDIDLEHLRQERMRTTSFGDCVQAHAGALRGFRRISFPLQIPAGPVPLTRPVPRFPFVPSDPATLDERCAEVHHIQVQGLMRRMQSARIQKLVLGVSGGLDSTHALLVCVKALDALGLPRSALLAYTLPGFATGTRTHRNAQALIRELGATAGEIDIRPSALQMLADIGHPYARGEPVYDVTFENVQAGERTSHLFRLANLHGGLVVGTSDLSELALGYTTYGVGDHMAHYAVNASVPKTLIRHLIRWEARSGGLGPDVVATLEDVLATDISPELVPASAQTPTQRAEEVVGPYELQDFNLYYLSRFGYGPSRVAFLAMSAWAHREVGAWPASIPPAERREYGLPAIRHWLTVFIRRFFGGSQFKRSALPNGPKVGSGGSLSPRGDWRAPSDAGADVWLEELDRNTPPG